MCYISRFVARPVNIFDALRLVHVMFADTESFDCPKVDEICCSAAINERYFFCLAFKRFQCEWHFHQVESANVHLSNV